VLCISNVSWSQSGLNGFSIETLPELEVTDGWYKLRAKVDRVLARAVRRGVLRVGRKIEVVGARVGFTYSFQLKIPITSRGTAGIRKERTI
jgi:breast cancer 2 susceptibility protein